MNGWSVPHSFLSSGRPEREQKGIKESNKENYQRKGKGLCRYYAMQRVTLTPFRKDFYGIIFIRPPLGATLAGTRVQSQTP